MRRIAFALLLLGCGSNHPGGGGGGGGDMAMGAMVPDPGAGSAVDQDFTSMEPNDTPAQATPLGVAKGPDITVWVGGNKTGGGDTVDYFVFKSGPSAGQFSLGMGGMCWMGAVTNLTATLWKVANGQQVMPSIHQWTGNGTCVKSMPGDAPVEANTVYLLGVTASGGAGTYAA